MITQSITKKATTFKYNFENLSLERCFTAKALKDLFVELENLSKEIERIQIEDYSYNNYLSKFKTESGLESLKLRVQSVKSQILEIKKSCPQLINQHQELFDQLFEQEIEKTDFNKRNIIIGTLITVLLASISQVYDHRVGIKKQINPASLEQQK